MKVDIRLDRRDLAALEQVSPAVKRAIRKAGSTALRDMRSEASKRIRARKRIKPGIANRAFRLRRLDGVWALDVRGTKVPLSSYPHRQTRRGVTVEVNRGKRTLLEGAFVATMKSGHKGIFRRRGKGRLPLDELLGSRPVDALLHEGEAIGVADRGVKSFVATFDRLLPMELEKAKGGR